MDAFIARLTHRLKQTFRQKNPTIHSLEYGNATPDAKCEPQFIRKYLLVELVCRRHSNNVVSALRGRRRHDVFLSAFCEHVCVCLWERILGRRTHTHESFVNGRADGHHRRHPMRPRAKVHERCASTIVKDCLVAWRHIAFQSSLGCTISRRSTETGETSNY